MKTHSLKSTYPIYETIETVGTITPQADLSCYGAKYQKAELFYTAGDKGIIRLWSLTTGELVKEQVPETNSKHTITDVIYAKASQRLAAVTNDQNILIYSIAESLRRIKQIVGYNDEIVDVRFIGEDDQHLAVATNSEQIRVFNVETQDCDIIYGHSDTVICLERSKDGSVLVSGSKDKTARLWRIDTDAEQHDQRYGQAAFVYWCYELHHFLTLPTLIDICVLVSVLVIQRPLEPLHSPTSLRTS